MIYNLNARKSYNNTKNIVQGIDPSRIFLICLFNPFASGILYFFRSPVRDYFQ